MRPGQRLILGLQDFPLTDSFKNLLLDKQIGGVILFDYNACDLEQLKKLIEEINQASRTKPFIGADFEGGRIRRLRDIFGRLDEPKEYAGDYEKLNADCRGIGRSFREVGLNLNFAPVADLTYSPASPALLGRTFSSDPSETTEYCLNFTEAFASNGIICCLKHFPGLGSAANDPHLKMAVSCISKQRFLSNDLVPFKAGIAHGIKMIMTTHMMATALDDRMTTFSKSVVALARASGFEGIIITDDMSMSAIKSARPLVEATLEALCAGHDMALICHDHDEYPAIVAGLEDNMAMLERHGHRRALERISDVKSALP